MVARAQRMRARMLAARDAHRLPLLAREAQRWTLLAAVPPREVFAVMEQMLGSFPFRFELTGESSARIVEFRRKGLVGQWSKRVAIHTRWVTCEARRTESGTVVTVTASRGRGPVPRALQLVQLLSRGNADPRTIYRRRAIPSGSGQPGRLLGGHPLPAVHRAALGGAAGGPRSHRQRGGGHPRWGGSLHQGPPRRRYRGLHRDRPDRRRSRGVHPRGPARGGPLRLTGIGGWREAGRPVGGDASGRSPTQV